MLRNSKIKQIILKETENRTNVYSKHFYKVFLFFVFVGFFWFVSFCFVYQSLSLPWLERIAWFCNREKQQWWIFLGNIDNGFYIHKIQDKVFKSPEEERIVIYCVSLLIMRLISKISQIMCWYSYRNLARHLLRHFWRWLFRISQFWH